MRLRPAFLLAAFFFTAISAAASPPAKAEVRPFRFEELAKARRVGGLSLSPDGKWVAYAVATPDVSENLSRSAIWLVPSAGGEARRLTSGDKRDSDPRFSPDGKRVAFLSNRSGASQIHVVDLAGGEPVPATSFPTEVNGFKWSPDGKWFLITSDVFPDCSDIACNQNRLKEREKAKVKARVVERLLFRHWDSWKEGRRTHIWKLPAAGGEGVDMTPGDRDAPPFAVGGSLDFVVSPDGKELVYAANPDKVEALSTNWDLWAVPFDGKGTPKNLTAANKAFDGSPAYSPDGKWIAYRAQKRAGFEADRFALRLLERATGSSRELAADFDNWVEELLWAPDSKSLLIASHVRGRSAIFRVGLDGGARTEVWTGGGASGLELSRDGKDLFFSPSSLTRAPEIWSLKTGGGSAGLQQARPVTHVNDLFWKEVAMGEVSERWTDSADGKKLHAWLVKPPGFDPAKKYPAVLLIHGGPQSAWIDSWSTRWNLEVFAAYGYVVYAANPRGSTGFGQEFVDQISGDWGGKVYDDLMRQTDDLESLPYVDKERIGAAGGSYGGYMAAWIAGHTDRFKTLVCHDGVIDTASMALETEELWFTTWDFGGWPWNSEAYQNWNPIRYAENFKTPTLVITNEKDYRVPFGQGLQFFTALQVQNVPSKLLTFPDEGHWVLKPGNSGLWHATVMGWLARYLGGAKPDEEALKTVYSETK